MSDWIREGARCQQVGGSRRHGTIVTDVWSGYVTIRWDSTGKGRKPRTESGWHISDIRPEVTR